eukprot:s2894_g4.t2
MLCMRPCLLFAENLETFFGEDTWRSAMGVDPIAMETCFEKPCCSARVEVPPEVIEAGDDPVDADMGSRDVEPQPSIAAASMSPFDGLDSPSESSRPWARSSTVEPGSPTLSSSLAVAKSLTKEDRLVSGGYSTVDDEIIWGIPLRRSLKGLGRIWRYQPSKWTPAQCAACHELSQKAQSFDVFLSHTWQTPGWHKAVALSFQCGWRSTFALWCAAEVVSTALCLLDVLPMPLPYKANVIGFTEECPMGLWVYGFGALALVLGWFLTPYLPDLCSQPDLGFIDVVSIDQEDRELMERGVYGIAGFLRISSELRILWSAPYLSRLWCIFELAAYRKVNPTGIMSFRPLFVERIFLMLLLSCLRRELRQFDLDHVSCMHEFDRQFIHSAISEWYGSKEAFTKFVREDLRQDLEPCLAKRFPFRYLILLQLRPMPPAWSIASSSPWSPVWRPAACAG